MTQVEILMGVHLLPRCQHEALVAPHAPLARARGVLRQGLGVRSGLRRSLGLAPRPPAERLGPPSAFTPGSWVRVKHAEAVRATLGPGDRLRGLVFVPEQWHTCGGVYRVERSVRRILGDDGRLRPVARTALLEGVTCAGPRGDAGCGRFCPLMYRDEWLEVAPAPATDAGGAAPATRYARVRPLAQIRAGLDLLGRQDGVPFSAGMERFCERTLPVARRLDRVYELDRWLAPRAELYLLVGAWCPGTPLGAAGPCDLACSLMWHRDWLELDVAPPA